MGETVMTVEDAASRLSEVVDRVQSHRETALLVSSGRPVARIIPVAADARGPEDLAAFLRRWRKENPDPDEQLAEVLVEARRAVQPLRDPWE